ncbi:MAG: B12-binding domain-containing radical SAM protein [Deltaproteobacteria bacterium]|nr:B12-binding domain-containing radical SAM protein [Deltaproteobacteria bacterium]
MAWEIRKLHDAILSREVGAKRKEWGGRLRIALVYPNRYAAGMSNLGFLSIHARINERPDALCERAFLPSAAEERISARRPLPLSTLESGGPLKDFDIVAFSLSYENDLLNIPSILAAGGVLPFRKDREEAGGPRPMVLAGGFAASLNPEPAGVFADAVVVGDGERAVEAVLDLGDPHPADKGYLKSLAAIPGVYVPAGYVPETIEPVGGDPGKEGRLRALIHLPGFPGCVARETVSLSDYPPLPTVLAEDAELGRMALVETSRGCPKMCGFCAAAHACPEFREMPLPFVRAVVDAAWPHRRRIGLIGAAVLDWSHFRVFSKEVLARGGAVSPASVRADLVDEEIADILRHSGHRTVSLAPECGSQRLRARIGKRVPDRVFFSAGTTLARAGIVSFKLYFLVGVPGAERDEEVEGAVGFLRKFRVAMLEECKAIGRMGTVTVVLSPFVPKPFTPLQWAPMTSEAELKLRQEKIAAVVRSIPNLRIDPEAPQTAILQGFLGLSDRRVEQALRHARKGRLKLSPENLAVPLSEIVYREKRGDEYFPWDVIEGGLPRAVLRKRYEAILRG